MCTNISTAAQLKMHLFFGWEGQMLGAVAKRLSLHICLKWSLVLDWLPLHCHDILFVFVVLVQLLPLTV